VSATPQLEQTNALPARPARTASLLLSGDGAEALTDEGEPLRTLQERFARRLPKLARRLGTVRGSFRLLEAEASAQETLHSL
jgi:hypothetical protein